VERQLNDLVERRATEKAKANLEAGSEKAAEHQRRKQIRERNRLLWIDRFERLAAGLRARAADYEARAFALTKTANEGRMAGDA
jgi:hypothetical protein